MTEPLPHDLLCLDQFSSKNELWMRVYEFSSWNGAPNRGTRESLHVGAMLSVGNVLVGRIEGREISGTNIFVAAYTLMADRKMLVVVNNVFEVEHSLVSDVLFVDCFGDTAVHCINLLCDVAWEVVQMFKTLFWLLNCLTNYYCWDWFVNFNMRVCSLYLDDNFLFLSEVLWYRLYSFLEDFLEREYLFWDFTLWIFLFLLRWYTSWNSSQTMNLRILGGLESSFLSVALIDFLIFFSFLCFIPPFSG